MSLEERGTSGEDPELPDASFSRVFPPYNFGERRAPFNYNQDAG